MSEEGSKCDQIAIKSDAPQSDVLEKDKSEVKPATEVVEESVEKNMENPKSPSPEVSSDAKSNMKVILDSGDENEMKLEALESSDIEKSSLSDKPVSVEEKAAEPVAEASPTKVTDVEEKVSSTLAKSPSLVTNEEPPISSPLDLPDFEEDLEEESHKDTDTPILDEIREPCEEVNANVEPTLNTNNLDKSTTDVIKDEPKKPDIMDEEKSSDLPHEEMTKECEPEPESESEAEVISNPTKSEVQAEKTEEGLSEDDNKTDTVPGENDESKLDVNTTNVDTPMDIMDTCDSQESINLIIDETCDITESKDENESPNKTDNDFQMIDDIDKNATEVDKKAKKTLTVDGEIVDTEDMAADSEVVSVDNQKESITDDPDKKKSDETSAANKSTDDDVITIEQPPMPVIEIDDDDEEPVLKPKDKENEFITPMEIDDDKPTETSKKTETAEDTDNLLCVVTEKSMDEITKEEESNKDAEDVEDTTDEVFYNKECINYECAHKHKQFFKVPQFAFSYFKVNKKKFKVQYICADCYDKALEMYEVSKLLKQNSLHYLLTL